MILSKDFVEKHISQQSTGSGYVLNLRMCHLQDLEYEFQWGRWIERYCKLKILEHLQLSMLILK